MRPALMVVLLVGCYRYPMTMGAYAQYSPTSRAAETERSTKERSAGCLDLSVSRMASGETGPDGVVVRVQFGNRCDRTVPIDFTRIRVSLDGGAPLRPNDPRRELHPARVEARTAGDVRLEFYAPNASGARTVCVEWVDMTYDVESTIREAPPSDPSPICVAELE